VALGSGIVGTLLAEENVSENGLGVQRGPRPADSSHKNEVDRKVSSERTKLTIDRITSA
jgi:hypothetical protein